MADSVTTGSAVIGLIPGMNKHMGGGVAVVYVMDDPDSLVTCPNPTSSPSGTTVAYDSSTNQLYQHTTGSTWQKLGSVE